MPNARPYTKAKSLTIILQDIRLLLQPLSPDHVRSVRGIGLNYAQHAHETNTPLPQHPILFFKPSTAVTGPFDPITIPKIAQIPGLDYECELVVIIGKACKDVRTEQEALDCVLGYAVGNDVSHREWQMKRGGGQWCYSKGFDGWAPFGPGIVTKEVLGNPQKLRIGTKINGRVVQESGSSDMVFGVAELIRFLSVGTTLLPGDVIFTGTPQGVGAGRKPPLWLKDGDVVEVELEGVGKCVNKVDYSEKNRPKL